MTPITTRSLFTFANNCTRGHNFKVEKVHTKSKKFQMFFSNRVVSRWNDLPNEVVNLNTIDSFKNSIDKIFSNIMYDTNINIYYNY